MTCSLFIGHNLELHWEPIGDSQFVQFKTFFISQFLGQELSLTQVSEVRGNTFNPVRRRVIPFDRLIKPVQKPSGVLPDVYRFEVVYGGGYNLTRGRVKDEIATVGDFEFVALRYPDTRFRARLVVTASIVVIDECTSCARRG
jgi:hypothetical protein